MLAGIPQASADKYASIIIDDLGNNLELGQLVVDIPAPITLAILPHTIFAAELAENANKSGKEVMLHLPLQSVRHHVHTPGTLKLHMTHERFRQQLLSNIGSIPHIRGVNNHMGSLMTQHPGYMDWLMAELAKQGGLYFIDSRTTTKSVAATFANKHKVPALDRDVFLDPDFRPETIHQQFARFIAKANATGYAIAIAHPHPQSLQFIHQHLDDLEQQGIKLVSVSELIIRHQRKEGMNSVASTGTTGPGL